MNETQLKRWSQDIKQLTIADIKLGQLRWLAECNETLPTSLILRILNDDNVWPTNTPNPLD